MVPVALVLLLVIPAAQSVQCFFCDDLTDCSLAHSCQGDFCFVSVYENPGLSPRWARGCLSGDLALLSLSPDTYLSSNSSCGKLDGGMQCRKYMEDGMEVSTCVCNGDDHCNKNLTLPLPPVSFVLCRCDPKSCPDTNGTCLGQSCALARTPGAGDDEFQLLRACVNSTIPFSSIRNSSVQMQPSMPNLLTDVSPDDFLATEVYLCDTDFCNDFELTSELVDDASKKDKNLTTCQTSYTIGLGNGMEKIGGNQTGFCTGDFCWTMSAKIREQDSSISSLNFTGCISYPFPMSEKPENNCVQIRMKTFETKICLEKN